MFSFILNNLRLFFKNKWILLSIFLHFIILFLHIIFVLVKSDRNVHLVPLHYNIYFGVDYFGFWYKLFIVPLLGLFIFFINSLLAFLIIDKKRHLALLLIISAIFCQIFLLLASIFLIYNI